MMMWGEYSMHWHPTSKLYFFKYYVARWEFLLMFDIDSIDFLENLEKILLKNRNKGSFFPNDANTTLLINLLEELQIAEMEKERLEDSITNRQREAMEMDRIRLLQDCRTNYGPLINHIVDLRFKLEIHYQASDIKLSAWRLRSASSPSKLYSLEAHTELVKEVFTRKLL